MSKNLNISVLCDIYGKLLPEKHQAALEMYYNDDLSLAEIAEQTGISRQGVRDQIKHAEAQLENFEKVLRLYEKSILNEKLFDRLEKLSENNDELLELVKQIRNANE